MSDYMSVDVVSEILSRLPAKSLIRSRCVCKLWNFVITSSDFINLHLHQTKTNKYSQKNTLIIRYVDPDLVFERYSVRLDDPDFDEVHNFQCPFMPMNVHFRVVGVCNGLLCLSDDFYSYTYTYIIWNPAIKRYLQLPKPHVTCKFFGPFMTALGFGFSAETNDCKVVRLAFLQEPPKSFGPMFKEFPMVEVYSKNRGSWMILERGVPACRIKEHMWTQAFLNGNVHWAAYLGGSDAWHNMVLSFNMDNDQFTLLEFPQPVARKYPLHFSIGLCHGLLALFASDAPMDGTHFQVYVMSEYGVGSSWTKTVDVKVNHVIRTPLGFRQNGHMLIHTQDDDLASYNPNRRGTRELYIRSLIGTMCAAAYEESLLLLDEGLVANDLEVEETNRMTWREVYSRNIDRYATCFASVRGWRP